jgi:hypothetical protein
MSEPLNTILAAITYLPTQCRYHADDFGQLGWEPTGVPSCDTCKPPWRRAEALKAVDVLRVERQNLIARLAQLESLPELRRSKR